MKINNLRVINTPLWFKSTPRNQLSQQLTSAGHPALFAFVRVLSVFSKGTQGLSGLGSNPIGV
jgi:hypothetical protein